MKRIDLPIGGITVFLSSDREAFIKSHLRVNPVYVKGPDVIDAMEYNTGVFAIEQMILGHLHEGIKINDHRYVKGLVNAVEKLKVRCRIP